MPFRIEAGSATVLANAETPRPVALALALGCSKSAPSPGKEVAIDQHCNEPDESRARLTGYLRYPRGLMSFCSSYGGKPTCDLHLYAGAEKPADYSPMKPRTGPEPVHARLSVPVGDAPGEMADLPEKYTPEDVVVHMPNDAKAGEGTKVVVDGKLNVIPPSPGEAAAKKSCFVTVEWVAPG